MGVSEEENAEELSFFGDLVGRGTEKGGVVAVEGGIIRKAARKGDLGWLLPLI